MAPTQTTNYVPHPMGGLPFPVINGSLMQNTRASTNSNSKSNRTSTISATQRESNNRSSDVTQKQQKFTNYVPHPMGGLPFPVLNGPFEWQRRSNELGYTQSYGTTQNTFQQNDQ